MNRVTVALAIIGDHDVMGGREDAQMEVHGDDEQLAWIDLGP